LADRLQDNSKKEAAYKAIIARVLLLICDESQGDIEEHTTRKLKDSTANPAAQADG